MKNIPIYLIALILLASCSTTKSIPDDDQLFIGLKGIKYNAPEKGEHYDATVEEIEAALATAPNGSLFGTSVRSPLLVGLWIWNEYQDAESGFGKWMYNSFATKPVLMSWINPALRASVAKEVLRAHGYFRGNVEYQELTMKNPKKAKMAYTVNMGHLFTIDTLSYERFTPMADSLIHATEAEANLHSGDAFDVSTLESERTRINTLLRNNGYYYYQPSYASYLADTTSTPGQVTLKFQQADSLPARALRQWRIGKVDIDLKKSYMEQTTHSIGRRGITTHYSGSRRPPVRAGVIFNALQLKPGELYSYSNHEESISRLTAAGMFSVVDFTFTPRDSTEQSDTLDVRLNCVLDRPYDFYIEANAIGKTSNRFGPGIVIGLTKRNAFRGGELLDINLRGSYEWQTGHKSEGSSTGFESYEYGADISLQYPRIMIPFFDKLRRKLNRRHRPNYYSPPSTTFKLSTDITSRADYFKRHIISAEWTYTLQPSPTERHQFSPLILSYEYMRSTTAAFDSLVEANPYLRYTMADCFVPKMQYVYTYTSPSTYRHPIWWQTTVSEGANLLSLAYMATGKKWGEKNKNMFGNPYAQFLKIETELVKTWTISEHNTLVGHVDAGVIWSYGNSSVAPYSEQFYVGGANSIRAFNARYIGPGAYNNPSSSNIYYLDRTGDIKLLMNLEYRPRLFGSLYGALFLDAGNVWQMRSSDGLDGAQFKVKNVLKEMAVGTGIGLRYDLEFLVIRIDWGLALHLPYKSGVFNAGSFHDNQTLHFAIGYPF